MVISAQSLLTQHVTYAFDRQLLFASIVGDRFYRFDFESDELSFGDLRNLQFEILGTESERDKNWCWAWIQPDFNVPYEYTRASRELKAMGQTHGIQSFVEPSISLKIANGDTFAIIAVGEGYGNAFFRSRSKIGTTYLLITDDRLDVDVEDPIHRVVSVFPKAIDAICVSDHRQALRGHLQNYGIDAVERGRKLVVNYGGEDVLIATFDDHNLLCDLNFRASTRN